ncbi:hypothetical protein QJS10_CPB13g01027 [Acorus calamus]|uniref:Uncharacterized protein n=1 Tax=Acorus calamus TaxID=4465 RepID=A0AAV9DEK1_ACOCL|nr:hypothetical protein QJS10_CPB13g01027 [Acorus calamus]
MMENNTPPSVRYNYKKVANRARGKRPIDPNKGHPGAEKFQTQPLYFEEECDILFGAVAAKGDDSWVPTSGSSARGKRSFGWSDSTTVEDEEDYQFTEHQPYSTPTPSHIPPTSNVPDEATSPRRQSPLPPLPVAPKRQRTAVGQKLSGSIDRMCDILEMRTNLAYGNDTVPKFADAMALVDRIPEIPLDSPVYFYALYMLRDPGNREVFFTLAGQLLQGSLSYPKEASSTISPIWLPEMLLRDELFPATEGLEGESTPSRAVPPTNVKCRWSVMLYVMRSQRRMGMLDRTKSNKEVQLSFQPTRNARKINMARTKRTKKMRRLMRPIRMCSIGRFK